MLILWLLQFCLWLRSLVSSTNIHKIWQANLLVWKRAQFWDPHSSWRRLNFLTSPPNLINFPSTINWIISPLTWNFSFIIKILRYTCLRFISLLSVPFPYMSTLVPVKFYFCTEGIQPCNMKNRGIYWSRYKIQKTLYTGQWCLSPLQSRHLGAAHSSLSRRQLPLNWWSERSSLLKIILILGKPRSHRVPNLGCRGAESLGWF